MNYYLNQKKLLEVNPRHPLIKDLLRRVEESKDDTTAVVSSYCDLLDGVRRTVRFAGLGRPYG